MEDRTNYSDQPIVPIRRTMLPHMLLVGLMLLPGCQPSSGMPPPQIEHESPPAKVGETVREGNAAEAGAHPAKPTSPDLPNPDDYYEAQFLQGSKVGYAHVQRSLVVAGDRNLVVTASTTRLTVKREGQPVTQEFFCSSTDTVGGQLVRFETKLSGGGGNAVTRGRVAGAVLELEITTLGRTETREIPWDAAWGGFYAVEGSLQRTPMKPGEKRKLKAIVPFYLQVADISLEAVDYEQTPLLSDQQELLRIKETIQLGGDTQIVSWKWCDRAGETLKSQMIGGIGGESYRTSKEIAVGDPKDVAFDLFRTTTVPVDHPLTDAPRARKIVYRVQMDEGDPGKEFADGPGQSRKRVDDHTIELTVLRQRLEDKVSSQEPAPSPGPADRQPNSLIQSDDDEIKRLAQSVAPHEKDGAKLAAALEKFVDGYIVKSDYSSALATAAEVARSRQGDCTEHAFLLAALCRARGLPARVVIGLVLVGEPTQRGFAYHMWNEVWIDGRWAPLDATQGRGGIDAVHLKLRDANLDGSSPYAAFLPVYQVLGQLKIAVVAVESGGAGE
jgi:hypothetical protein